MCAVLQQKEMSFLLPIPPPKLPKREGLLSTHRGGYRPRSTESRSPEAQPAAIAPLPCLRGLCAWESGHHSALSGLGPTTLPLAFLTCRRSQTTRC